MADIDINTVNPQPELTAPATRAGSRIFFDRVNSGRDYDSLTGKRNGGLVDPADVSGQLQPTLVTVSSGAVNVSLEELVSEWGGNLNVGIQEYNPNAMEVGVGTTAGKVVDTFPDTPVSGDLAAGSTKSMLQLAATEAAAFSSHIGKPVLISRTDSDSLPLRGYIASVNTTDDEIYLAFPLDEIPPDTGTVQLLEGFDLDVGGNQMLQREVIMATDFGNGASHRCILPRTQPIGGYTFADGQDKAKHMLNFKIQGYTKLKDGRNQVIPMSIKAKYGTAAIA